MKDPATEWPGMNKLLANILAIGIGVLPVEIFMVWYRLVNSESFTLTDMLVYPLVIGGGNILLILLLNRYLLHENLAGFNRRTGKWHLDIVAGIILAVVLFLLAFIERLALAPILSKGKPPTQEVLDMMTGLAANPVLLAIWMGPVVWIGVAAFEELARTFFLNCLWRLSNRKVIEFGAILFVSIITGILHLYQGPFGIISVSIQGLVAGYYYYRFGRIWPLIISHALYDSIQMIMFVLQTA